MTNIWANYLPNTTPQGGVYILETPILKRIVVKEVKLRDLVRISASYGTCKVLMDPTNDFSLTIW